MPGVFIKFNVGTRGASAAHARYITRAPATESSESALYLHNYPEMIRGSDYDSLRERIVAFNEGAESAEMRRTRTGGGHTRTHYRIVLSFEEKVETEVAREMAGEFLVQRFALAMALAAVHQDTDNTHVHVSMLARQVDGKKIHLGKSAYKTLDESWAALYGQRYGLEKAIEHYEKKQETKAWKREWVRGERSTEKPARKMRKLSREVIAEREGKIYDKGRIGDDQRAVAGGERAAQASTGSGERAFTMRDEVAGDTERASAKLRETVRVFEKLGAEIERCGREDRSIGRGR